MAKFQLCEFRRTKGDLKGPLKKDNPWERGIALVKYFGTSDVITIIDKTGKRVNKIWDYRLINGPAYTVIDTCVQGH